MKKLYKSILLATVMGVLVASPVFASEQGNNSYNKGGDNAATSKVEQESEGNSVLNANHQNNAGISDSALQNASGNIGVNVSAGDNNMQNNDAAILEADEAFVFRGRNDRDNKSVEAKVDVEQESEGNSVLNNGNVNNASVGANALQNASGNIGVNLAAGANNVQNNSMSAVTGVANVGNATVSVEQEMEGNATLNQGLLEEQTETVQIGLKVNLEQKGKADLKGGYVGGYLGIEGGGYQGVTQGTSDQIGDVYPDVWPGETHPGVGPQTGHFDLDTETQGGSDLNKDGGALAFGNNGTEEGTYGGLEMGVERGQIFGHLDDLDLKGCATGTFERHLGWIETPTVNNAGLGDSALKGAKGNIGVNIASGTQNMQNNSLAISSVCGGCDGAPPTNETPGPGPGGPGPVFE